MSLDIDEFTEDELDKLAKKLLPRLVEGVDKDRMEKLGRTVQSKFYIILGSAASMIYLAINKDWLP